MGRYEVNVYFDESGKSKEPIHLMGAVSIPKYLYEKHKRKLNKIVSITDIHWTKYGGHYETANAIRVLLKILLKYPLLYSINIISFNYNTVENNSRNLKQIMNDIVEHTIYSKFPERVIYGVLRKYGKHTIIEANIYIEHDNVYEPPSQIYSLSKDLPKQLNIQSVYRNDTFIVKSAEYRHKKEDFGIEFTDLVLGFIRNILLNEKNYKGRNYKKRSLIYELLMDDRYHLYELIENIRLYEWDNHSSELSLLDVKSYLQTFIGTSQAIEIENQMKSTSRS